ncbi:MAG: glycosyltransferase, partial [Armatimonadota bacterium]
RRKLAFVATAHTQYELYADRAFLPEKWVERVVSRHVGRFFILCDVVTTPVNWMRQRLLDKGVTAPIEILFNPVDLSLLADPDREGTRRRLGFAADEIVVGFLGRLSPVKRTDCVIDAVHLLSQRRPGVRLMIAGDGGQREILRQRARRTLGERAVFTGAIPHPQVKHYHAAMDVFVTASRSETMPLAYIEAMHVGTPVVAHATPGAADMIRDGDNGLLVPPERGAEGLAQAVERVLNDPALRARLVEGGRRFAQRCHYPTVAERLEQIYALAIERAAARQ